MEFLRWCRDQYDRVGAVVAVGIGLLALLAGWLGVSRTVYPAEQLPYLISGGLLGLFFLGLGATLWLSADLRDEWRKLDRLEQEMRRAPIETTNGALVAADAGESEDRAAKRTSTAASRP